MLGLEMSDGAKGVSVGGGTPYPHQPLVITPQGVTPTSTCDTINDFNHQSHGCYGNGDLCDVISNGIDHQSGDISASDQLCPLRDEAYRIGDANQAITHTKQESEPGLCAACGGKIVDRYYLLAVDRQWHLSCLRCTECQLPLDSEVTCFAKDDNIYCKEDYYRMFGLKRCARCQIVISSNELVMKARDLVYHLNCFTCASCGKILTTGEQFGMQDSMIYCRMHYEVMLQQGEFPQNNLMTSYGDGPSPTQNGHVTYYNGVGAVQKGRPRKRKSPLPDMDYHGHHFGLGLDGEVGHIGPDGIHLQAPRQKRIRTSFKHHQLRIMKSYFALNHNPDAKDLKQLAQKTGLNKRVLQVWFQNARAKYRRNLLKQEGEGGKGLSESQDGTNSAGEDTKGALMSSGSATSDLSGARSPALSDISSSASLSDYNSAGGAMDDNDSLQYGVRHDPTVGIVSELFGDSSCGRIN